MKNPTKFTEDIQTENYKKYLVARRMLTSALQWDQIDKACMCAPNVASPNFYVVLLTSTVSKAI